jgi:hypothetical protein
VYLGSGTEISFVANFVANVGQLADKVFEKGTAGSGEG